MKEEKLYLQYILECIARIEENLAGGQDSFFKSHTLQDAILRNLQTLSESTKRLSEATKALQVQVPWDEIAAFRNILVHDYLGIDTQLVWDILEQDLPVLKDAIQRILKLSEA